VNKSILVFLTGQYSLTFRSRIRLIKNFLSEQENSCTGVAFNYEVIELNMYVTYCIIHTYTSIINILYIYMYFITG